MYMGTNSTAYYFSLANSSISDFSAHRKNYSYCYVYGISNVGHWEIKTQQIFVIGVLIPMDYEDYYYESRSRYYDACSEVNNYENRVNELRSQRQRKNYISISSNQI
jgi:hypothetical protein